MGHVPNVIIRLHVTPVFVILHAVRLLWSYIFEKACRNVSYDRCNIMAGDVPKTKSKH